MKLIILPFTFTVILTLMAMVFFAKLSHENIIKYNENSKIVVNTLNLSDHIEQEKIEKLNKESEVYLLSSKKYLLLYTILIIVIAGVLFFMEKILFSLFISIVSIMSLSIAIFSPLIVMIVEITKEDTTLIQHNVKTFIDIIDNLLNSQQYGLTLTLILVAILIPLIKASIILIYNFLRVFGEDCESYDIIKTMGWWSMVDVVIFIILIDFVTLKDTISNEIVVESGLYFFIIYLFLSIISIHQLIYAPKTERN